MRLYQYIKGHIMQTIAKYLAGILGFLMLLLPYIEYVVDGLMTLFGFIGGFVW